MWKEGRKHKKRGRMDKKEEFVCYKNEEKDNITVRGKEEGNIKDTKRIQSECV